MRCVAIAVVLAAGVLGLSSHAAADVPATNVDLDDLVRVEVVDDTYTAPKRVCEWVYPVLGVNTLTGQLVYQGYPAERCGWDRGRLIPGYSVFCPRRWLVWQQDFYGWTVTCWSDHPDVESPHLERFENALVRDGLLHGYPVKVAVIS